MTRCAGVKFCRLTPLSGIAMGRQGGD